MNESSSVVARHGRARVAVAVAGLFACTGCIPLMVGPNNFRPAGELHRGAGSVTVSAQMGPILNMPGGLPSAAIMTVDPWFVTDVAASFAPVDDLLLEFQVDMPLAILPPIPVPIGLGGGGRTTFLKQDGGAPLSMDALVHASIAGGTLTSSVAGTQTKGTATMAGGRVGVVLTRKVASYFSASLAPYFHGYRFDTSMETVGSGTVTRAGGWLLAGGASLSVELKLGPFVFVPAFAVELDGNPHGLGYFFVMSPGLQLGFRW